VRFFEALWGNLLEGVSSRALAGDFAAELLRKLGRQIPQRTQAAQAALTAGSILNAARAMPAFSMLSGSHAALFPHQEAAVMRALSRWPIRVLLADEVGLGKTFEAGAIVSYLLRHGGAESAAILAPRAVVNQWQAELSEHFSLDAWVFESSDCSLRSSAGELRYVTSLEEAFGRRTPRIVIMSSQLARGTRRGGHAFAHLERLPDLLVVDEAHAARVRPDVGGSERPTLLWKMLKDVASTIPHLVLASATPMQVHWREYHALLELLGLPSIWADSGNYLRSLEIVADNRTPGLQEAADAAALLQAVLQEMRPALGALEENERDLIAALEASRGDPIGTAALVRKNWSVSRSALVKLHPAHLLTVRNTRGALESIGYRFPQRELEAPSFALDANVTTLYREVDAYLSEVYFQLERALDPELELSTGFVQCSYQQRLASSLSACQKSLTRRRARVTDLMNGIESRVLEQTLDEVTDSDFADDDSISVARDAPSAGLTDISRRAATVELHYLNALLARLDRILAAGPDPKIKATLELIVAHLGFGDSILVFSRYTDTLDAVVAAFNASAQLVAVPYGIYTAKEVCYDLGLGRQNSTRAAICAALSRRRIQVLFCSDAAAEGLNLQAARVLINVDVPWNPARLEQRIGRIARLGQKAPKVKIYNLWYPDSIEAKMYHALMNRKELFELAVGEFPEVVSRAIREEVLARFGREAATTDALAELRSVRNQLQTRALKSLWTDGKESKPMTKEFREHLGALAIEALTRAGGTHIVEDGNHVLTDGSRTERFSTEPGSDDSLSLAHPALRWLEAKGIRPGVSSPSLLCSDGRPFLFASQVGDEWSPADPRDLPQQLSRWTGLAENSGEPQDFIPATVTPGGAVRADWIPNHEALSVPVGPGPSRPRYDDAERLRLSPISSDASSGCT
jgi:superfamily II DNA or RNA helicase